MDFMSFRNTTHHNPSIVKRSLSRRLSYTLIGVIACIVLMFATLATLYGLRQAEFHLRQQLFRTLQLAETSLASAIWQLNQSSIHDVLQAIFIDESVVYARVLSDDDILAVRTHSDFPQQDFAFFQKSSQFITQTVDIHKNRLTIGTLQLAVSRQKNRQDLRKNIILISLLTLLIIASVSITSIVVTKRYILSPLSTLLESVRRISNGKFDIPIILGSTGKGTRDEIEELAWAFDEMRDRLQQLISHIKHAGEKMQSSSERIFMTVNQLAATLEQQSASVLETTTTMESMTATSRQISGNTDSVADMAEQTKTYAQQGVDISRETIEKMQEINDTGIRFLQKIIVLGERSENIGDVIELINDIADRTKLIAFNAALEAVGSKDIAGKRFNVVAIEIRRLADTIIESTEEINSNILEIQQSIRELTSYSTTATQKISEGADQTKTMNDWLQEILVAAIHTTDEARQIAFATQEQKTAHEQILLALKEISDVSKQFVSAGSQLSTSADEMNILSKELHTLITYFECQQEESEDDAVS